MSYKVEEKVTWILTDDKGTLELTKGIGNQYIIYTTTRARINVLDMNDAVSTVLTKRGEKLIKVDFNEDTAQFYFYSEKIPVPRLGMP